MSVETIKRRIEKGRTMTVETTVKVTCDGCGRSRSVDMDNLPAPDHPSRKELWYGFFVQMSVRRVVGQSVREFGLPIDANGNGGRLDACSVECVHKALAKIVVPPLEEQGNEPGRRLLVR